jgi:hypothetical protein
MAAEPKTSIFPTALIGLIGTLLTTCGGISGALITSAVTIYQVNRQNQQVALPASAGGETLSVDTGNIFITRQQAAALDGSIYYANLDQAFVLHRPLPGWDAMEEMTVEEQLAEDNVTCVAVCEQRVYRISYGEPIEVESDLSTTVNGQPIPENMVTILETMYGSPPWKLPYYSQVIVNVFEKSQVQSLGIRNLPDLILLMTRYTSGRVNRLVSRQDSHFALVQLSGTYEHIRLAGEPVAMTVDSWLLFAEAEAAFYTVEIRYTPQSGQPLQVWDDLQLYVDQFRVIQ